MVNTATARMATTTWMTSQHALERRHQLGGLGVEDAKWPGPGSAGSGRSRRGRATASAGAGRAGRRRRRQLRPPPSRTRTCCPAADGGRPARASRPRRRAAGCRAGRDTARCCRSCARRAEGSPDRRIGTPAPLRPAPRRLAAGIRRGLHRGVPRRDQLPRAPLRPALSGDRTERREVGREGEHRDREDGHRRVEREVGVPDEFGRGHTVLLSFCEVGAQPGQHRTEPGVRSPWPGHRW